MEDQKQSGGETSLPKIPLVRIKKEEGQPINTGREIIENYLKLDPPSIAQYQQMLRSMDSFDSWSESSRIEFLKEFFDIYAILDGQFNDLVHKFCRLQWHKIPHILRHDFINFLSTLAIHHVHHVSTVFGSFTNHFLPINTQNDPKNNKNIPEMVQQTIEQTQQEELYRMAHKAIQSVICYNPLSSRVLLKCCIKQFPHIRQPAQKLLGYVRNLIQLAENSADEEVAMEIWSLIMDRLLQLDASVTDFQDAESRLSFCNNSEYLGASDFNADESEIEEKESQMEAKLDQLIAIILHYCSQKQGGIPVFSETMTDVNFKAISTALIQGNDNAKKPGDLYIFKLLLEAFDEHVLPMVGVHSTPFIWFYICSLSKQNCSLMLEFLWEVLRSPVESPNEWKKCHNAAAFLCGFLARANYVDFELSCSWLRILGDWCLEYIGKYSKLSAGGKNIFVGGLQHGTFYATVQALLFVFCYRHNELQGMDPLDHIKSWHLDQLVFNCLNPLQHISQGVALCFLNLNKRLHLLESGGHCSPSDNPPVMHQTASMAPAGRRRRTAVDIYFPFSFCSLKICSPFILPLMRRFSPMPEKSNLPHGGVELTTTESGMEIPDIDQFGGNNAAIGIEADDDDGGMLADEGYEEELMCVQSVHEFSKYLMEQQLHEEEEEHEQQQDMEP